jgi:hypothetical protein
MVEPIIINALTMSISDVILGYEEDRGRMDERGRERKSVREGNPSRGQYERRTGTSAEEDTACVRQHTDPAAEMEVHHETRPKR